MSDVTKLEAMARYRWAYAQWRRASSEAARKPFEEIMDETQPFIASGPGPEWDAFMETLPGVHEAWREIIQRVMEGAPDKEPA